MADVVVVVVLVLVLVLVLVVTAAMACRMERVSNFMWGQGGVGVAKSMCALDGIGVVGMGWVVLLKCGGAGGAEGNGGDGMNGARWSGLE